MKKLSNVITGAIILFTVTSLLTGCSSQESPSAAPAVELIPVSDVHECGGNDGETWYWAPCFKVELEPFTKMQCKIDALDANGDVVATMENEFNTLNGGSTTGFGDGAGTQDTTEEIYKSIKSLDVACHL